MMEYNELAKRYGEEKEREAELLSYNTAMICASIYEQNRNPKKRRKPFSPQDFLGKPKKKQTDEQMLSIVKSLHAAYKGG